MICVRFLVCHWCFHNHLLIACLEICFSSLCRKKHIIIFITKESEKDWAYRIKDGNLELCDLNHFQGGFEDVDELLSQNQNFRVSLAYYVYKPLKDFTSDDENSFLESLDGEWYNEGKDQLIDFDKSKMQVYNDGFDVYYGLYESPVENSVITGPGPEQEFVYLLNYAELIDDDTLLLGEGMTEYNVYHRR